MADQWQSTSDHADTPIPVWDSTDNHQEPKTLADHVQSFLDQTAAFHPARTAQGLADMVLHPGNTAESYGAQNQELLQKAKDAWNRGDHTEAAAHAVYYLLNGIPGLGYKLDAAGGKAAHGDYGGAAADTGSAAIDYVVAPKAGGAIVDAATEPETAGAAARTVRETAQKAKGAAVGGVKGALELKNRMGIPIPASATGAVAGGIVARELGLPEPIGATVGAAAPVIRGAIKGWQSTADHLAASKVPEAIEVPAPAQIAAPADTSGPIPAPVRDLRNVGVENPAALPMSRQLPAGNSPIVTAPPADTSGVVKGWQPTILENEKPPELDPLPASRQLPAVRIPIVTPSPEDTSGVIKGWRPNILENEKPGVPGPGISPAHDPQVLEDITKGLGGKSFNDLSAEGQQTVRGIADRIAGKPPAASRPAPAPLSRPIDIGEPQRSLSSPKALVSAEPVKAAEVPGTPSVPGDVQSPEIPRVPVTSSNVHAVGYDPSSRTMHVEFKGKTPDAPTTLYEVVGVPPDAHAQMMNAPSIGAHYAWKIKPNFPARRLYAPGELEEAQAKNAAAKAVPPKAKPVAPETAAKKLGDQLLGQ